MLKDSVSLGKIRVYLLLQIEPGDSLPSLAVRYGVAVDAIKRANAIVSDADMYARGTVRIPDFARKGQTPSSADRDRGHSKRAGGQFNRQIEISIDFSIEFC